ncbi:sialidase family protein [Sphingobacterium sp.]|uniref:sialidase family protein n=1 Tax=Sphingobacterium sp. TaxID=341027 RepID=UPI0028B1741F|nr:sialidase family protein [Sphingobacterium sp.]
MKKIFKVIFLTSMFFPGIVFSQQNSNEKNVKIISKGGTSGEYQAFTDAVKLKNGDLLCVFYAGEGHVTYPSDMYPKTGRICMVRSSDNGKTWSAPETIYDDDADNRDPHVSQMSDGSVVVTFFNTLFGDLIENQNTSSKTTLAHYKGQRRKTKNGGIHYIVSSDNGNTWGEKISISTGEFTNSCSAPMRELKDGTWVYPAYHQGGDDAFGTIYLSINKGKSWSAPKFIGKGSGQYLPAETDVIQLKDGSILAALRGDIKRDHKMHFSISNNAGQTWENVYSSGFQGHCPHFLRLSNDAIVLTYRAFKDDNTAESGYTGLRISYDEGKTWQGPYLIDQYWGAYASTIELPDKNLLITYYEEGENSAVRVLKTSVPIKYTKNIHYERPETLPRLKL